MEDVQRRKLEMFERVEVFLKDNAADFPKVSPGGKALDELSQVISTIRSLAGQQISGAAGAAQSIGVKDDELDDLMLMIRNINRAANAFESEVAGSDLKFRLPRNRSEQNILATARAFRADAEPLEAKFIEYGLPAGFLAELQALIDSVDAKNAAADSATEQRAAATGGLAAAIQDGMNVSRRLDAIVRIKYADNPAKLAAWTVASHLERAPQRRKDEPPTT
jgi:hypothetical protein